MIHRHRWELRAVQHGQVVHMVRGAKVLGGDVTQAFWVCAKCGKSVERTFHAEYTREMLKGVRP